MTARAARDVIDNVINTTGMISATTAHDDHGEVVLDAGPNGTAEIGGSVDASGKAAGATGGAVAALGGTVVGRQPARRSTPRATPAAAPS